MNTSPTFPFQLSGTGLPILHMANGNYISFAKFIEIIKYIMVAKYLHSYIKHVLA